MAGDSVEGAAQESSVAENALASTPKNWTWRTVVACKRLNEFEVWASVRGWNKKGLPRRKRWDILRFIADHAWLAVAGDREASVRRWLFDWAPGLTEAELVELIDAAESSNWLWRSDACAELLGISASDRETHNIRFLGANDDPDRSKRAAYAAARRRARRERDRLRKAAARKAAGATPRAESLSQTKPWAAMGISRSTWERRRKRETETDASVSADNQKSTYERTDLRQTESHPWTALGISKATYYRRRKDVRTDLSHAPDGDQAGRPKAVPAVRTTPSVIVLQGEILSPGDVGCRPPPPWERHGKPEDATVATSDREEVLRLAQRYTQERLALARFM